MKLDPTPARCAVRALLLPGLMTLLIGHTATVMAASHAAAPAAAASAPAATGTCTQQATDRKLAGAAKSSFMTRCEREATERCEAAATEKKLAGAARTANLNKCLRESVGEK